MIEPMTESPRDEYRQLLEQALEKARLNQDANEESKILLDLGYWFHDAGDQEKAAEHFRSGLKHLKATLQYAVSLPAMLALAQIYLAERNRAAAFNLYTEIIEFSEKVWDKQSIGLALAAKGEILLEEGSNENGFECLFRSFQVLEEAKMKESDAIRQRILRYRAKIPRQVFDLALAKSRLPQRLKELL